MSGIRKRQKVDAQVVNPVGGDPHMQPGVGGPIGDDAFVADQDAVDSAGDDDEEEEKKGDKKAGRRKIKIEFITDKSRRHITFSKRKAGIMKKAYELSTLTGTQVLLLVVSETGLVYTFTTAKLQPLVTQPEGKNLIQACLNAPHGSMPSSMPVGPPIGRTANPLTMSAQPPPTNMPGGLTIGAGGAAPPMKGDEDDGDEDEAAHGGRAMSGDKRRRRTSNSNIGSGSASTSPHNANAPIPPPLSIPPGTPGSSPAQATPASPQMPIGASPTSPQQQHASIPQTPSQAQYSASYGHQQGDAMYSPHMMQPGGYNYGAAGGQQQLGSLATAAAQHNAHNHWQQQPQQQAQAVQGGTHYGSRR